MPLVTARAECWSVLRNAAVRCIVLALIFICFRPVDAHSYDVTGTVTLDARYYVKDDARPGINEAWHSTEYKVTFQVDQGRHVKPRSKPPAMLTTYEDHYYRSMHVECFNSPPKNGVNTSDASYSGTASAAAATVWLKPVNSENNSDRPSPLKAIIDVPSAFRELGSLQIRDSSDLDCARPAITGTRPGAPGTTGGEFELPLVFEQPIGDDIDIHQSFDIQTIKHDMVKAFPNVDWQGTIEVDLRITHMPKAVGVISEVKPQRGTSVAFDASASTGDFGDAVWEVKIDDHGCKWPTVRTTASHAADVSAKIPQAMNPLPSYMEDVRTIYVRYPGQSDRMVRFTDVLCPFTARLIVSEDVDLKSVGKTINVLVTPRDWSATFIHEGEVTPPPTKFKYVSELDSLETGNLASYMDNLEADPDGPALAMNVNKLCLIDHEWNSREACLRHYEEFPYNPGVTDGLQLAKVPDEGEDATSDGLLSDTLGYAVSYKGEDGPFSGLYYWKSPPDHLFRRITIFNPYLFTRAFVEENNENFGNQAWRLQFYELIKLHEYLHTYFLNKDIRDTHRQAAVSEAQDAEAVQAERYDPATVLEQMHDPDPLNLISRSIAVILLDGGDQSGEADHIRMMIWKKSIAENEYFEGRKISEMINSLRATIPLVIHGKSYPFYSTFKGRGM